MSDLISCIVTTYKRPVRILKRAIDSIVSQTYKNIELIVVNDAPEEMTLSNEISNLIKSYDVKSQYIIQKKNSGACAARNTGIEHANGKYLAFLDDDDEWFPCKLELQIETMHRSEVALVYCSHIEVDANGNNKHVEEELAGEGIRTGEFERLLRYNFIGSTSFPLLNTEAVKNVGGFTVGLKSSQDHDLWIRIAEKYQIEYCRKPLVKYNYSEEAISRNMSSKLQGYEYLLNKYSAFYECHKDTYNYRLNYLSYCCFKFGDMQDCWKYLKKAVKCRPLSIYNFMIADKAMKKIAKKCMNDSL